MLRKPTQIFRATLQETPLSIVGPEGGGEGSRRVTLLVQSEPIIEIAFDVDPKSIDARDSYWVQLPGDLPIVIELLPAQWIVGRSVSSVHELGVIVEYLP